MASRQDYFTLLSHDKQVDGTEEEVLHTMIGNNLTICSPNGVRTCSDTAMEDQLIVTNTLDMTTTYVTFECSFISLDMRGTST